ncbi:polysialyltransferase family glycosyltransferase [Arthrobacter sp. GCM10027362]|uniref:polysialyltransferase family glycosyltransferase n=1 Tax=Arthrobacter sp. GCM10027362 TaxID=3273379 RepID=UPI00362C25AE
MLVRVPGQALRNVIAEAAAAAEPGIAPLAAATAGRRSALLLGQYLAHLGLGTQEQETDLHADMLRAAVAAGVHVCIFKPHPGAGPAAVTRLKHQAFEAGVELLVADTPVLAEVLFELLRPDVVVGCFSTRPATAKFVFDIPTVAVGTEAVLESLAPYENSNRIPLTIIDAVMNRGFPAPADAADTPLRKDLQGLVDTVAYCMQSRNLAAQHRDAADFLSSRLGTENMRYLKRRRLLKWDLPASLPAARPGKSVSGGRTARRGAVRRLFGAMLR